MFQWGHCRSVVSFEQSSHRSILMFWRLEKCYRVSIQGFLPLKDACAGSSMHSAFLLKIFLPYVRYCSKDLLSPNPRHTKSWVSAPKSRVLAWKNFKPTKIAIIEHLKDTQSAQWPPPRVGQQDCDHCDRSHNKCTKYTQGTSTQYLVLATSLLE